MLKRFLGFIIFHTINIIFYQIISKEWKILALPNQPTISHGTSFYQPMHPLDMAAKIAADSAALTKATEFSYYPPFFHPSAPNAAPPK